MTTRDFRRMLTGVGAKARPKMKWLSENPLIAEIEAALSDPSIEWQVAFTQRCDEVSLALFGVDQSATRPREPMPDKFDRDPRSPHLGFDDAAFNAYGSALSAHHKWQATMEEFEREIAEVGRRSYWRARGFDVTDESGAVLKCLRLFERQLFAAVYGLLPNARVTLNGSGKKAPASVADWAAALEAEAMKFRPTR